MCMNPLLIIYCFFGIWIFEFLNNGSRSYQRLESAKLDSIVHTPKGFEYISTTGRYIDLTSQLCVYARSYWDLHLRGTPLFWFFLWFPRKIIAFAPLIPYVDSAHGNPSKIVNLRSISFIFEHRPDHYMKNNFHADYEADQQYISIIFQRIPDYSKFLFLNSSFLLIPAVPFSARYLNTIWARYQSQSFRTS